MKKIILLCIFLLGSLVFSVESKETILTLIKKIEINPESKESKENFKKVFEFAVEDDDVIVELIGDIFGTSNDKIDEKSREMLLMSYIIGSLKIQLESKQAVSADKIMQSGIDSALQMYKKIKKTTDIKIDFYEKRINTDK